MSFETIEHHDKHEEMMLEIKRVLKPEGVLVISSPDKTNYSVTPKTDNHFHIKELYRDEFKRLLDDHFLNHRMLGQSLSGVSLVIAENQGDAAFKLLCEEDSAILIPELSKSAVYLIAAASDVEIAEPTPSIYLPRRLSSDYVFDAASSSFTDFTIYWGTGSRGVPKFSERLSQTYQVRKNADEIELTFLKPSELTTVAGIRIDPSSHIYQQQLYMKSKFLTRRAVSFGSRSIWLTPTLRVQAVYS